MGVKRAASRPTNQDVSDRPFVYGLQRIRDLRALEEDRAKEALATSLSLRISGEAMLRAAQTRLDAAHDLGRTGEVSSAAALLARQAWSERLERHEADAVRELAGHDNVVAARQADVTVAGRNREVLDRLRERKLAEHRLDARRREGVVLDEIALQLHARVRRAA